MTWFCQTNLVSTWLSVATNDFFWTFRGIYYDNFIDFLKTYHLSNIFRNFFKYKYSTDFIFKQRKILLTIKTHATMQQNTIVKAQYGIYLRLPRPYLGLYYTGCKSPNDTFLKINILKESLVLVKQTIPQQKALDLSFNLAPWKWAWHYHEAATPS